MLEEVKQKVRSVVGTDRRRKTMRDKVIIDQQPYLSSPQDPMTLAFLILERLGRSPKRVGKGILARALGREDRNPSLSVVPGYRGKPLARDFATGETLSFEKYVRKYVDVGLDGVEPLLVLLETASPHGQKNSHSWSRQKVNDWIAKKQRNLSGKEVPIPYDASFREREMLERNKLLLEALKEGREEMLTLFRKRFAFIPPKEKGLEIVERLAMGIDSQGALYFPHFTYHNGGFQLVNIKKRSEEGYRFVFSGTGGVYFIGNQQGPNVVYVVEGEINAATLGALLDDDAFAKSLILSPGSAGEKLPSSLRDMVLKWAKEGVRFVIKGDTDPSGKGFANRIQGQLAFWGVDPKNISVAPYDPKYRDLNTLALEGGRGKMLQRALKVKERRVKRADPSRGYILKRLEEKTGNLRSLAIETAREVKALSRIQDRTKPLTGEVHEVILLALRKWIKRSLDKGIPTPKGRSLILATSAFLRALDRIPAARYLLGALRASLAGKDKSVWEYGRKRGLLDAYRSLLTWKGKETPIWNQNLTLEGIAGILVQLVLQEVGNFHPPSPLEKEIGEKIIQHRTLQGPARGRERWNLPEEALAMLDEESQTPHFKLYSKICILIGEIRWQRSRWYQVA